MKEFYTTNFMVVENEQVF